MSGVGVIEGHDTRCCCSKIAEAEAVVSINEKKWLVIAAFPGQPFSCCVKASFGMKDTLIAAATGCYICMRRYTLSCL